MTQLRRSIFHLQQAIRDHEDKKDGDYDKLYEALGILVAYDTETII